MTTEPSPSVRLCLWLVGVSLLVLVALGAFFVPWSWVPGGHLVAVRGSEVFSPAQLSRAQAYSSMQRHLGWASLAVSMVVSLVLGLTALGARATRRLPGPWWLRIPVATLAVLLVGELATLPFSLVSRGHALDYGLTHQALGGWLRDQAVSLVVSWVFASVLVVLVIGTARRSPRRWPLWTALAGAVLTVLGSWVYPVVVEPLFNHFTSLPDGQLRTRILALAKTEQVPVSDVLVADASRRTTTLNAYVSGFGSTRRVVLYDNLVKDVPQRETLSVVGHELGHARHHDVLLGTALGSAGVVLGSGLLGLVLGRRRLLRRASVADPGQPEAVALLLALAAVGALLASPVQNTVSRAMEARADRAAIESTHDYTGFERVQVSLATHSLSSPHPPAWSQFWFGTHPTTLQRLGLARALQRQETGEARPVTR
ncbi:MAG: peptidase Ste24p [Marmoricola sp.]|nr:peptidase Ste24p [Marmoricola sp.]